MTFPSASRPKVLVCGGGIGGLAVALTLLHNGFDCEVFEQASELREVGAGLWLSANGARVLFALGLGDELRAAAIAAQGLLRLGHYLQGKSNAQDGARYFQAGLTVLDTLFNEPYLSTDSNHQGLILHSIYHRPNGWDRIPPGSKIPRGESSQWGDYHAREVALYVKRIAMDKPYYTFFGNTK